MTNSIAEALEWGGKLIESASIPDSSTARLDAEIILAHVLEKDRSYLYAWPEKQLDNQSL